MPRLWIATIAAAVAALGLAPAAAQATVTSSNITSWTSSELGIPSNSSYLISLDNPPNATTLTVNGTVPGALNTDRLDIVCYFGPSTSPSDTVLVGNVPVVNQAFSVTTRLRPIAGHACRLRAIASGSEGASTDVPAYAGPQVAVSEVASLAVINKQYDFFVNPMTFTSNAAWGTAGSCGPAIALLDSSFAHSNLAINCVGSLLGSDLPVGGTRSEVEIDGQDAYDAASAQAVFNGTEDLGANFPVPNVSISSDPTDGLAASSSTEGWVVCSSVVSYPPTSTTCPHFAPAGVQLQRNVATRNGGLVVTMTDTWSSTDGRAHALDLLYDDVVGLGTSSAQRGYEFPGQSAFSAYGRGASLPAPGPGPGSILVRSNLAASDGDPSEAAGAITFATPPSGFTFVGNNEFEEHRVLQVPAGGSASVTYIYSTAYTVAQARSLALAAQDRLQPLAVSVTSPASGTTTSIPSVSVNGTATAGSGISSLVVAGQTVPVGSGGTWSAAVPLASGSNTINVLATDGAGATAQGRLSVIYQVPPPPASQPPPPTRCKVPRTKGMKLRGAEKALRRAHCRVGRIKHVRSKKIARGRVISTSPGVGRRCAVGHKIEIFVSKGAR